MLRLFQAHPASSEPRWGSGAYWMSPTQGSRCASTLGYGRFPLQGMAGADVGLCSSRDVLRSNADGVPIPADGLPIGAGVCRGMSSGADTEVRRGRGPREFIDLKGTAGSASARHPPKPFPEGEIFHSLGLTRSGYPR